MATSRPKRAGPLEKELIAAATRGDLDCVDRLLAAGADPNAKAGRTGPLVCAVAEGGRWDVVLALVRGGADVNARPKANDKLGFTLLHNAVLDGDLSVVEALLELGADPVMKNLC